MLFCTKPNEKRNRIKGQKGSNFLNVDLGNFVQNIARHFPPYFHPKLEWKMICLQQFYNIFTTNLKWQVVIGCYCWVKKVISVLNSNLNQ